MIDISQDCIQMHKIRQFMYVAFIAWGSYILSRNSSCRWSTLFKHRVHFFEQHYQVPVINEAQLHAGDRELPGYCRILQSKLIETISLQHR